MNGMKLGPRLNLIQGSKKPRARYRRGKKGLPSKSIGLISFGLEEICSPIKNVTRKSTRTRKQDESYKQD